MEAVAKGVTSFLNNQKMLIKYSPDFVACHRVFAKHLGRKVAKKGWQRWKRAVVEPGKGHPTVYYILYA